MQLVLDDQGHAVLEDGEPVFERNGEQRPFDAAAAVTKLKDQADGLERLKDGERQLTAKLEQWQSLGELADVRQAVALAKGISAEEAEALPAKVAELEAALEETAKTTEDQAGRIHELTIGHAFGNSAWVRENLVDAFSNRPERLRKLFEKNFEVVGKQITAVDDDGKQLYSVNRPGELATFEEALDQLCSSDMKRPSGARGGDAPQDGPAGSSGRFAFVASKAELSTPEQKAAFIDSEGLSKFQSLPLGK
jgi:hypothetical protein